MRPELQDIVDEVSRLLGADTTLEDTHFNLIAYGSQNSEGDTVRRDSIMHRRSTREIRDWFEQFGISRSLEPVRTPADPEHDRRARLCFPARWRGVTYGYLWVLDDQTALDDPAVRRTEQLAEHAASFLAQLGRQRQDEAFAVSDLISADVDKVAQAADRLVDRGAVAARTSVVAVVVGLFGAPAPEALAPNLWGLPRPVLADQSGTGTLLLVPLRRSGDDGPAQEAAAMAVDLYRRELPADWPGEVAAGIGDPQAQLSGFRASWTQARVAARVAAVVATLSPVARWSDLGLYRLLATAPQSDLPGLVLDEPVRRLLADPELARTVSVFLDRAGNVAEAAAALHIHRQTLYYRLTKVETLTGLRLSDGQDRTRLHLGLMLAPLLDS